MAAAGYVTNGESPMQISEAACRTRRVRPEITLERSDGSARMNVTRGCRRNPVKPLLAIASVGQDSGTRAI